MKQIFAISLCICLLVVFFSGCEELKKLLGLQEEQKETTHTNVSIRGKWKLISDTGYSEYLEFLEGGKLSILDGKEEMTYRYETIEEVTPHQLYCIVKDNEQTIRYPWGIYKIVNNKLIIRSIIEYHRSLGGFDMGISRYEIPKDFSGVLNVYERIK